MGGGGWGGLSWEWKPLGGHENPPDGVHYHTRKGEIKFINYGSRCFFFPCGAGNPIKMYVSCDIYDRIVCITCTEKKIKNCTTRNGTT